MSKDLESRIDRVEEQLLELLDQKRWLLRAIGVIGLTLFGQVCFTIAREIFT